MFAGTKWVVETPLVEQKTKKAHDGTPSGRKEYTPQRAGLYSERNIYHTVAAACALFVPRGVYRRVRAGIRVPLGKTPAERASYVAQDAQCARDVSGLAHQRKGGDH